MFFCLVSNFIKDIVHFLTDTVMHYADLYFVEHIGTFSVFTWWFSQRKHLYRSQCYHTTPSSSYKPLKKNLAALSKIYWLPTFHIWYQSLIKDVENSFLDNFSEYKIFMLRGFRCFLSAGEFLCTLYVAVFSVLQFVLHFMAIYNLCIGSAVN